MAVFGDLAHHAFPDLMKVLRPRTGSLFFHQVYQGRTLELVLQQGELLALYIDGFPVRQQQQLLDILRTLAAQARGTFEFKTELPVAFVPLYHVPLDELAGQLAPLSAPPSEELPHPDTRFVLHPNLNAAQIPATLHGIWQELKPHLAQGRSAAELAQLTAHPVTSLRLMLYRLRAADLIAPQRAFQHAPPHRGPLNPPRPYHRPARTP